MKLDDAISNTLKGYLSKQLEPICEADPTVLADYVIALLKHEKPIDGLKALCMNQLEDFLKEATNGFVDSLFTHLTGLGLIEASQPAASEAPAPTNSTYPEAEADGDQPYEPPGDVSTDAVPLQTDEYPSDEDDKDTNFKRTTRKDAPINPPTQTSTPNYPEKRARPDYRSSNRDRGGDDNVVLAGGGSSWEKGKEPRQNDHKRRRSEDGNTDDAESRSGKRAAGAGWGQPSGARRDGFERGERGRFQGQGWDQPMGVPVGAGVGWGQPGTNGSGMVGVPAMPPQQGGGRFGGGSGFRGGRGDGRGRGGRGGMRGGFNGQNRRMPCTDYEQQGFCMRGDACPFEHPNPVVYEAGLPLPDGAQLPFDLMAGGMPMRPPFAGGFGGAGAKAPGAASEAYDPDQSALQNGGPTFPGTTPIDSSFTILPNGLDASGGRNVMRGGYGSRNGLGPRGGRGGGGGGANRNAPYLRPTRDTIVVENIPYEFCNIAKVNEYFSKFGNIINLQVDQQGLKAVVKYGSDAEGENAKNNPAPIFDNRFVKVYFLRTEQQQNNGGGGEGGGPVGGFNARPPGGSQFGGSFPDPHTARQSATAASQELARQKAKEALEQTNKLINECMENQKKLVAKMSDPKLSAEKKKAYQEQFQQLTGMVKQFSSKKVAQMEMLKPAEQKAKEKEKERLDRELDLLSSRPDWEGGDEGGVNQALKEQLESLKVKAEQQGIDPAAVLQGGAGRGRGGYGRGRGRGAFGRGGARSLDNRTTKIKVTGVPPADHENVKAHLMQFGEVISAEFKDTEDFGVVHFKNRWEAEKAFVKPPTIDSAPALKFSWLNEPAAAPVIKTEEAPAAADAVNGGAGDAAGGSAEVVAGFDEFEEDDTGDRNWKR